MSNIYNHELVYIRENPDADITNKSVVWINDAFDANDLHSRLRGRMPAYIVSSFFNYIDVANTIIYTAPLWVANNTRQFIIPNLPTNQTYQTRHLFNFVINKKQVNRFLCMKFVELFRLSHYDYTWSGVDSNFDMTDIIDELHHLGKEEKLLTEDQQSLILSPIQIAPKWLPRPSEETLSNGYITNDTSNWPWNHGLNEIFCSSVTSLITESLSFQKGAVFTEKTSYAILGKTFPLWIGGGANQAQHFEEMGFDVFHDVIDHSYQYYDTLIERCYYAFKLNMRILTDYEHASKIRKSMMPRLERNQHLIKNKQIDCFCQQRIGQWPEDLQQAINDELKNWIEG